MEIETTRFGRLDVDDERIINFGRGLLGFPDHTRYALIQTGTENYFFWLQCVDEPSLAFVVTDPTYLGLNLYWAIPAAFLVVGLAGYFLEVCLIRFLYGRPLDTLLATWGRTSPWSPKAV